MSAGTSYSMLRFANSSVDPYTRSAIGTVLGFALALCSENNHRFIGKGTMIAGALQIIDVTKRGRLVKNQCNLLVYVIGENSGISVIEFGQVPSDTIDGFSFKGLHGVFKFSDGIYAKINLNLNLNNEVQYTPGLGKFINQNVRSGGYKTKQWVDQQSDLRWKELFGKSI